MLYVMRSEGVVWQLGDIAKKIGGVLDGPADRVITGAAPIAQAGPGDITFFADGRYADQAKSTRAGCIIVGEDQSIKDVATIRVKNPRLAFAQVLELFQPQRAIRPGIDKRAVIAETAEIGENVSIQAGVVVGAYAKIGDGCILYPGVVVGEHSVIGAGSVLYSNVTVCDRVTIGQSVILHPGCVIGADGFGYVTLPDGHRKMPHIGTVVIEDDVEIGANTTIDRATTGETRIKRGTKIDNLVQIGHNVQIGEHCLIVGQAGIAGSAVLEDRVTVAGQGGVAGHLTVGKGSVIAARGLVAKDLPAGSFVSGFPARPHKENMRMIAATQRLPDLIQSVTALKKLLADLEARIEALEEEMPAGDM